MQYLTGHTKRVTEALAHWPGLGGCVVCSAYAQAVKPTLLRRPRLCICLKGAQLEPVMVGEDGRRFSGQFGIDIYVPDENGADRALALCDEVLECLLVKGDLSGVKFTCGAPHMDSVTGALLVRCIFEAEEVLV